MSFQPELGGLRNSRLSKEAAQNDGKVRSSTEDMPHPVIAAVEGGFHIQYLLFMRKGVTSVSAAAKLAFLLKIQSNCCWDRIRPRILEIVSKQCRDNTVYPRVEQMHVDGFLLEILPKSDRPEILPPDVQKKIMSESLPAISMRITIDRSAVNLPLCTPLATGLSAFTKLNVVFPSAKLPSVIHSSQSSVQGEADVVPQWSTACDEPFSSRPAKRDALPLSRIETPTQPINATVTGANINPKPTVLDLSSISLTSNSSGSTKLSSATTDDVSDSVVPVSSKAEPASQPATLAISQNSKLPLTSVFSAGSAVMSVDSSRLQKQLKNVISGHESVMRSSVRYASGSHQAFSTVLGSMTDKRQNTEATAAAALPALTEVITVDDDDDDDTPQTEAGAAISTFQSSSVQLSTSASHSLLSHTSASDDVLSTDVRNGSVSQNQSTSVLPVLSADAVCPVLLADANTNSTLTSSVSVNMSSSQPTSSKQSVPVETSVLYAAISSPGSECTAIEVEQATVHRQKENVECSSDRTEPHLTGFHLCDLTAPGSVSTETSALPKSLVIETSVNSLACHEELSDDMENCSSLEQKSEGASQQRDDMLYWSVESASAEEVVGGTQLVEELNSVPSTELSTTSITGHQQQQLSAEVPESSSVPDSTVQIVLSDEVCKSYDEN